MTKEQEETIQLIEEMIGCELGYHEYDMEQYTLNIDGFNFWIEGDGSLTDRCNEVVCIKKVVRQIKIRNKFKNFK